MKPEKARAITKEVTVRLEAERLHKDQAILPDLLERMFKEIEAKANEGYGYMKIIENITENEIRVLKEGLKDLGYGISYSGGYSWVEWVKDENI